METIGNNLEKTLENNLEKTSKSIPKELHEATMEKMIKYLDESKSLELIRSIWEFAQHYVKNKKISNSEFSIIVFEDAISNFEKLFEQDVSENTLLDKINSGEVLAQDIIHMKPHELNPEKYHEIMKRNALIQEKKNNIKTTDAFTCFKCKQSKCTISQVQTRSADEPMTVFVTCQNCGFIFKK